MSLSASTRTTKLPTQTDAIIIGGGHNGLVCAAYLSKLGLKVIVLEKRHCIGGAAVTEEIYPGFKFSRASYLAGLFRPQIIKDLELVKYGFEYISRNPSSFTPTLSNSKYKGKYLLLGSDENSNYQSIAQFSKNDAENYIKYEAFLTQIRELIQPLLDHPPPDLFQKNISWKERLDIILYLNNLFWMGFRNRKLLLPFYELLVGSAKTILDRYFDSDILKATLATDAVIGAMHSPSQQGKVVVVYILT